MSVPPENDEKLPLRCTTIELVHSVEVLQQVLLGAADDLVRAVADQGGGLCLVCRQGGEEIRKVDLPEQFRSVSHLSRREGRGVWPEGADGMRMRVEEGEVDGGVAVESMSKSVAMDVIETSELADPFEQERGPVQVEDVCRWRIPEVISIRRCVG